MKRIDSLQGLRAIGFILIFLWHCGIGYAGAYSVSLFFMLSGFCMMLKNIRGGQKSNVIVKLYPLHVVMTIVAVVYYL